MAQKDYIVDVPMEDAELEEQIKKIEIESEENEALKKENRRLHEKIKLLQYQMAKYEKTSTEKENQENTNNQQDPGKGTSRGNQKRTITEQNNTSVDESTQDIQHKRKRGTSAGQKRASWYSRARGTRGARGRGTSAPRKYYIFN